MCFGCTNGQCRPAFQAAVCSTFVMIWGTQKAFRGKKEEISQSVTRMYAYRRSMVRMLLVGVMTNMVMAAIAQFAKSGARDEDGFKIILALISVFFMGYIIKFCKKIHEEFKVGKRASRERDKMARFGAYLLAALILSYVTPLMSASTPFLTPSIQLPMRLASLVSDGEGIPMGGRGLQESWRSRDAVLPVHAKRRRMSI